MSDPILDDYRAGMRIDDIVAKHDVSRGAVHNRARHAGLRRKRPSGDGKKLGRPVTCQDCQRDCWSKAGLCRDCQKERRRATGDYGDDIGLSHGRWVPGRWGVLRWVPDEREEAA